MSFLLCRGPGVRGCGAQQGSRMLATICPNSTPPVPASLPRLALQAPLRRTLLTISTRCWAPPASPRPLRASASAPASAACWRRCAARGTGPPAATGRRSCRRGAWARRAPGLPVRVREGTKAGLGQWTATHACLLAALPSCACASHVAGHASSCHPSPHLPFPDASQAAGMQRTRADSSLQRSTDVEMLEDLGPSARWVLRLWGSRWNGVEQDASQRRCESSWQVRAASDEDRQTSSLLMCRFLLLLMLPLQRDCCRAGQRRQPHRLWRHHGSSVRYGARWRQHHHRPLGRRPLPQHPAWPAAAGDWVSRDAKW